MELNIIFNAPTLDECQELIETYLKSKVKIQRINLSIFEQYRLYPGGKIFIPKIWNYRIVAKNNLYYFGTLDGKLNGT